MVEFWRAGGSERTTSVELAKKREAEGWDGQMFMDSQSISADPYVLMGAWAVSTERLKLCTSTTNPSTRHPVVTAACAATLQSISGGRAILGIGRGDSALAYLGYAPAKLQIFQRALQDLQTLLSGGEVEFGTHATTGTSASVESMSLGDRPKAARLQWLPEGMPKVPLDVAATGPKVIEMSASLAERLTFSVGAVPERIKWALETARNARAARGLGDDGISYGAQIVVVCHPEIDAVMDAAASMVAPLARFQVIQSNAAGPQSESDTKNFATIRAGYDMTKHSEVISHEKLGGAALSQDFIRRFAIVGPPEHCIGRLLELHALGIERFVVVGPGFHREPEPAGPGLFVREVMPAVRAAISASTGGE
jgi:5,10-methylenetetrahydromethanopterin reductase